MSIYQITFSPTGGTQKIANAFTKAFSQESIQIDLTNTTVDFSTYHFKLDDICIIAVPSYGGRVPGNVIARLKQMSGGKSKAILISVYGNRAYEDTLLELKDTLDGSGFCCEAAIAAVSEHSIMHQFATGRPDSNDCEELATFAKKIQKKIKEEGNSNNLVVPGRKPYREYKGIPLKPKAGKSCTKCGLCASKCPVSAIPTEDPSKTDKAACISCMRCIAVCPNKSRSVNQLMLTVAEQKMKKSCDVHRTNELFL